MRTAVLLVLSVFLFTTPVCLRAQKPAAEKDKLQGFWKVVKAEDNGEFEDLFLGKLLKIDGDTIFDYEKDLKADRAANKLSFSIDAAKQPKEIDLYGYRNGKKIAVPLLGIFAFEKDKLRLKLE